MPLVRSIGIGGIRFRLILLALIAAIPFVWYRIDDIRAVETANIDSIRALSIRMAARGAAQEAEVFAEVRTLLSVIAKVPAVTAGTPAECAEFLKSIKDNRDWAKNLLVAGPTGEFVCSTDAAALGLNVSDRTYFQAAIATRQFSVSDFIYSKMDNQPILAAAYPAYTATGELQGILIASLNLSWFSQTVAEVGKTLGARVLLVDRQGTVLAQYPQTDDKPADPLDPSFDQAFAGAQGGWFENKDMDGIRRLYGVAELTGLNARLAVGISIEAALADSHLKIKWAYISAAAFGVLIILLALLSGEVFFLAPLRDLLSATRQLTEGDLAARAKIRRGSREFRELATSFNIMADRLSTLATVDGLTGVANRRRFDQYLDEEWRRALRSEDQMALALIDIDGFKLFNDNHGHRAGDECLRAVASELSRFARRSEDLLGRYGGEEFVIGLPGLTAADAYKHAERIRSAIEKLTVPELGEKGRVTVSIGVAATMPTAGMAYETLVAMADAALYEAKRAGRNRIALFRDGPMPATIHVA